MLFSFNFVNLDIRSSNINMNIIKKLNIWKKFPILKKCPYCSSINILKNYRASSLGVAMTEILPHDSPYKDLSNWILKRKFNCRSCKIKLGFFIHSKTFNEAIIWLDFFVYSGVVNPFFTKKYSFFKKKTNWFKTFSDK